MLLSQNKVNELLQTFDNPKSIEPYNISYQKEEVKNASQFLNDYHLYGPPKKYQTYVPIETPIQPKEITNLNQSLNSQNEITNKNSVILSNDIQNLQNAEDIEMHQSIFNLKNGQKDYIQKKSTSYNNYIPYTTSSIPNIPKYDPKTQSIYEYEYQKNENILNSILTNPTRSFNNNNNQYLNEYDYNQNNNNNIYNDNYNYNYNNNYNYNFNNFNNFNNYSDFRSTNNINSSVMKNYNYKRSPGLKDIPSHPEDVIITEIPQNYALSMNPVSSTNLNGMPIIPQEINQAPKMVEEINTDLIPTNEEINQNENENQNIQKEEPVLLESLEPQKEEEPQIEQIKEGMYKITNFNGPVKVPQNYSTNDEDEFNAIQILNEDISSWKLLKDKDNIKVYSKIFKMINRKGKEVDNIVFYVDALIDHPAKEVNKQAHNYSLRAKWEKSLQKGKILKEEHLENNIDICEYYYYIKMPFVFSDRDAILRSKTWNDYLGEKDCYLTHLKSIEHPDYPPKDDPVRALYENAGQYIKPVNENQCKFYSVKKFDFDISVSPSMMEGSGGDGTIKSIKELISHCGK